MDRCPKCGGNLMVQSEPDGVYLQCLQCSHTRLLRAAATRRVPDAKQLYRNRPLQPTGAANSRIPAWLAVGGRDGGGWRKL